MTETDPATRKFRPRLLRRAVWLVTVAAVLTLAGWIGFTVADTATAARCFGFGGVWSEDFEVCECANYGGRWEGQRCIRPK